MKQKFKLSLTTHDGEVLAFWDETDFGDLSKPLAREHFAVEVLSTIDEIGAQPITFKAPKMP